MPFRPMQVDTGFNAYVTEQVTPEPPKQVTTLEAWGAALRGDQATLDQAWAETQATIGAAFRMENDVVNTFGLLTKPEFKPDPTFDVVARLKADDLWNDMSEPFLGVGSEQEYLFVKGKIAQEEKDRLALSAAGTGGLIAQMGAGLLSPTILLPFVGGLRGAKAVGMGLTMGFAGGALQEAPLQLNQLTRTAGESASSIAMSTVLGGLLGGGVAFARRDLDKLGQELIDLQVKDMAVAPGAGAISSPRSVGAASAEGPVPQMTRMGFLPKAWDPFWDRHVAPLMSSVSDVVLPNNFSNVPIIGGMAGRRLGDIPIPDLTKMIPTVYNMKSRYGMAHRISAVLEDSGLQIDGATPGGTVANRVRTYDAALATSLSKLEQAYARYRFGTTEVVPGQVTKAKVAGLMTTKEKLSALDFRKAVGRAMREGDQSDIPEVAEMAKVLRTEIYDPLFEAATAEGLFKDIPAELLGDSSYLNRVYDLDLITMRRPEFIRKLADHYNQKLEMQFREQFDKLKVSQQRLQERADDFARPADEVAELREEFEQKLKALEEGRDEELVELEDTIADLKADARALPRGSKDRARLEEEARSLESEGGEALAETRSTRQEINRRLKNLRQAYSQLASRQAAKLDKIERAEDLSFNTLQRLIKKASKLQADFSKVSDETLEAELVKLRNQFAEAAVRYDKNEERIAAVFADDFVDDIPTSPFVQAAKVETQSFDKMTDVAERIEQLDVYDREVGRATLQAAIDDATMRAQSIVERRAVRNARLADQAKDLDPAEAAKRIDDLRTQSSERGQEFFDLWRERGGNNLDPVTGKADFHEHAMTMAERTAEKILGTNIRLPGMDMILNPRDVELARTLDIPSNVLVSDVDGRSFLVDDVQDLAVRYQRTLAPDIELHRALGDFASDMGRNELFLKLNEEVTQQVTKLQEDMKAGINPETGKKVKTPYTQEQIDKRSASLEAEASQVRKNLEAMIGRIRHEWGLPQDPTAISARAAKVASNVNVLRFMNMVLVSSFADVARPIMKHGLLRTMKDGWVPFAKGMVGGPLLREGLTGRHLRATGAALDVVLHSRSSQLFDVGDYVVRGSKFEKALEFGSSKIGVVALFDYWTAGMKQIAGSVANARLMDSLAVVAGGEQASARELAEATQFLAENGVDPTLASMLWRESQKPGGSELVDGQWWPNTEGWSRDARMAYNSAILRNVNNTIITPSVDAPLFMDRNPTRRLFFQFKSFAMASTTRTVMAGLQQRDMAFAVGSMFSLALGAFSYYTYANIVGGKILEEMQADIAKGDYSRFADEAINRSGLLGFGADLQSLAASIPGLNDYATFSGSRSTRQNAGNISELLLGPTFGDLLNTGASIATGAVSPTQGTLHQLRTLMPLQNHFLFRRIFDAIEAGAEGILPERRS